MSVFANTQKQCRYAAFGRIVDAPVGLGLAAAPSDATADIRLVDGDDDRFSEGRFSDQEACIHRVRDCPGGPLLELWQPDPASLVIAYDSWRFWLDTADHAIWWTAEPANDASLFGLTTTLERVVLPLYMLVDNPSTIAVHGSAVAVGGRAFVCIGRSGAGKSTTAYELMRAGAKVLADDLAVIDVAHGHVLGASPTLRLWKDAAEVPEACQTKAIGHSGTHQPDQHQTGKQWFRVEDRHAHAGRVPLEAVVVLDPDQDLVANEPRLQSIDRPRAVVDLLAAAFDFSNPSPDWMRRRFQGVTELVRQVGCHRLVYAKSTTGKPTHLGPLISFMDPDSALSWPAAGVDDSSRSSS